MVLSLFTMLTLVACQGKIVQNRYSADYLELFNTVSRVIGYAKNEEEFQKQSEFIHSRLKFYHEQYNAFEGYDHLNNIYTINKNAGIGPVKVDDSIIDMLEYGQEVYEETGGRVNILMGSVTFLWHNYRGRYQYEEETSLPSKGELQEAILHTDIDNLVLDRIKGTAFLKDKDARLDVGAIAKGYAAQRVADEGRGQGIEHMLMSIGGNVVAIGSKLNDKGEEESWQVGVQNPDPKSQEAITPSLGLIDMALVSSGDYERYYIHKGEVYAHIIDPKTLFPPRQFREVTILAKDSGKADAYSTALFIMSLEEGKEFIRQKDAEAMWVLADGTVEYSEGFRSYEKP